MMKDIIRIIKSFEDSGLLMEGVSETIQNKTKEQTGIFVIMLLDTLSAVLLGNILESKGINRAGERIVRNKRNKKQDHENKVDF